MSMCVCEDCGRYIDSDDYPDCFVEVGNMKRLHKEIILCESCRQAMDNKLEIEQAQIRDEPQ